MMDENVAAALPVTVIRDWEHFETLAAPLIEQDPGRFWFRGQADINWPLRASLGRPMTGLGEFINGPVPLLPDVIHMFEKRWLDLFQQRARELRDLGQLGEDLQRVFPEGDDLVEWWVLMQHYSAPTRLLDWSACPYIASFFAVAELSRCDGVLWIVDPSGCKFHDPQNLGSTVPSTRLKIHHPTLEPCSPLTAYFIVPEKLSRRMERQQTRMTLCTYVAEDLERVISRYTISPAGHQRWIIPANIKPEFNRRLLHRDISAWHLFPDLDGLGRTLKTQAEFALDEIRKAGIDTTHHAFIEAHHLKKRPFWDIWPDRGADS